MDLGKIQIRKIAVGLGGLEEDLRFRDGLGRSPPQKFSSPIRLGLSPIGSEPSPPLKLRSPASYDVQIKTCRGGQRWLRR